MTWFPPTPRRERILLFGPGGVGKSEAVLRIGARVRPNRIFVLDTDFAYDALLTDDDDNMRVTPVDPSDWEGLLTAIEEIRKQVTADDWLVIDGITPSWEAVQSWYTEQVFGKSIDAYFLEVRKRTVDSKNLAAFEGFTDWNVVNKTYALLIKSILSWPSHLILTAEAAPLGDAEGADNRATFGPLRLKPRGQKRLGHITHTVLYLSKTRAGEYQMSTVKDRRREELEFAPVRDFGRDYLWKIAGWRPAETETETDTETEGDTDDA